jgi:hypothetical protein
MVGTSILRRALENALGIGKKEPGIFNVYEGEKAEELLEYLTTGKMDRLDTRDLHEFTLDAETAHPLRLKMTELAREYREAEQALNTQRESTPPPKARWTVVVHPKLDGRGRYTGEVTLSKHLQNRDEFDAYLTKWGQGYGFPESNRRRSVTYFLKELPGTGLHLVCHKHGGNLMLKDDLTVTKDAWSDMLTSGGFCPNEWLR